MVTIRRKADFRKNFYELNAWEHDQLVCGIDEVGRGCLAGPVVAAAVILPSDHGIQGLDDSKRLTPKKRELLKGWLYWLRNIDESIADLLADAKQYYHAEIDINFGKPETVAMPSPISITRPIS